MCTAHITAHSTRSQNCVLLSHITVQGMLYRIPSLGCNGRSSSGTQAPAQAQALTHSLSGDCILGCVGEPIQPQVEETQEVPQGRVGAGQAACSLAGALLGPGQSIGHKERGHAPQHKVPDSQPCLSEAKSRAEHGAGGAQGRGIWIMHIDTRCMETQPRIHSVR